MSDNRIGENHPDNPFSAAGRANGKSTEQLRKQGLDGGGNPLPSQPRNGQASRSPGPARPGGSRGEGISQLAGAIGDMDLCNQNDIHAYCEAVRKVLNYIAISNELAKGQLKAASRAQAKESVDGRLTLQQKLELGRALNSLSRDLNGITAACVSGAAASVKAWRRFDGFLGDLDSGASRPGKGRRGLFSIERN
jgi:hypothetical protein